MAERIVVNTVTLASYATRIQNVINRLYDLNSRIRKLYYTGRVSGLYSFVQSNRFSAGIDALADAKAYINGTVSDLEWIENHFSEVDPLHFTETQAALLQLSNKADNADGAGNNLRDEGHNGDSGRIGSISDIIKEFLDELGDGFGPEDILPSLLALISGNHHDLNGDIVDEWASIASLTGAVIGALGTAAGAASSSESIDPEKKNGEWRGALFSGQASAVGEILGIDLSGKAEGEFLGASAKTEAESKFKIDKDSEGNWDKDTIEIKVVGYAEGEAHVAQGEISGSIGYLSGGLEGTALTVEGRTEAGLVVFDEGKFAPALSVEAKGGAAVAKGSAETSIGTDQNNLHAKADGTLLGAEAEAGAALGVIRTRDEATGKEKVEYGLKGEAKAEAYLAEGSVSGGFTIFGIDIDIEVEGKAGGAGAEVGGSVTNNGVSGEVGLGLGLGAGLNVSVDWSDFAWPDWPW